MGHPSRKVLRERQAMKKEKMLGRKNNFGIVDLTPHNAMGKLKFKKFDIKLK